MMMKLFSPLKFLTFGLLVSGLEASPLPMPTAKDYSQIWWVDGFPNLSENARWIRKIQTGYYSMELNTQTLEVPQVGLPETWQP